MKRQVLLILIFSYLSYSCVFDSSSQEREIIEQRALDFMVDSLLNKRIINSDEGIFLKPTAFDSAWIDEEFLKNQTLYSDFIIDSLSYPQINRLTIISNKEFMADSTYKEAIAFLDFYEAGQIDFNKIDIVHLSKIEADDFRAFRERKMSNTIFIKIYKNIEGKRYKMVRIKFYRYLLENDEFVDFSLILFFNFKGDISHWQFE